MPPNLAVVPPHDRHAAFCPRPALLARQRLGLLQYLVLPLPELVSLLGQMKLQFLAFAMPTLLACGLVRSGPIMLFEGRARVGVRLVIGAALVVALAV